MASALVLVDHAFARTRHHENARELISAAVDRPDAERRALVVADEVTGTCRAIAVFGVVAGTDGTARVLLVAGEPTALGTAIAGAIAALERDSVRLIVAEVPGDAAHRAMLDALHACDFADEGRVEDYVEDGTPLHLLARR